MSFRIFFGVKINQSRSYGYDEGGLRPDESIKYQVNLGERDRRCVLKKLNILSKNNADLNADSHEVLLDWLTGLQNYSNSKVASDFLGLGR